MADVEKGIRYRDGVGSVYTGGATRNTKADMATNKTVEYKAKSVSFGKTGGKPL